MVAQSGEHWKPAEFPGPKMGISRPLGDLTEGASG